MDQKLIAWARAVKSRRKGGPPPLWVFSDRERLPDPSPVLRRLPKGLCGLVLRPGGVLDAAALRRVQALCRDRRVSLVVSGRRWRGFGATVGVHLSQRSPAAMGNRYPATASAHGVAELRRAERAKAGCVFLSPVFPTRSHPGASALGPVRWGMIARKSSIPVLALGGITGASVRRVPARWCAGVGVIGAASG
jgi:thiamine-phosphate pyrophosphorylase